MQSKDKIKPLNFFILGAAKCGTSSLHYYLSQHPDIYMSEPKEPIFFEAEFQNGIDYYFKKYFEGRKQEHFLGESRHRNLYLPYVPLRISETFPAAKLIIILRNPVDRAYSHYFHRKIHGYEKLSFEDAIASDLRRIRNGCLINTEEQIDKYVKGLEKSTSLYVRSYLDSGYYSEQIDRYLQYFPKEQIHITFIDDFVKAPQKEYVNILKFLGVEHFPQNINFEIVNKKRSMAYLSIGEIVTKNEKILLLIRYFLADKIKKRISNFASELEDKIFRKKEFTKEMRIWLSSHYKPYNKRLEELTGRNLSNWDEKF